MRLENSLKPHVIGPATWPANSIPAPKPKSHMRCPTNAPRPARVAQPLDKRAAWRRERDQASFDRVTAR